MKILIVEDHENLRLSLQTCFAAEGFEVAAAASLGEARTSNGFDLVVLDWMLPDGQGIDFLGELRRAGSRVPVIMLTARAETLDKVLGLELGASDYVTKPFEPRELVARVRARLRETPAPAESPKLSVGALVIDREKFRVTFKGQAVELVRKEFDLLYLLAQHPEKVFSRDELLNKVWGYDVYPTTRTVDTHVMLIRQKLSDELIETVRSVGYKFKPI